MTIQQAKRELWNAYKDNQNIVGVGIQGVPPNEVIAVFLAKSPEDEGPSEYEGYKVIYEVTGTFHAL